MKGIVTLSLAFVLLFTGCSTGKTVNVKDFPKPQSTVNTKGNTNASVKQTAPAVKNTPEKSEKLQNEVEQTIVEIDKIMDSLDDIDESKFDF